MAYQAGKQEITIDSKRYPTGAILPTTAVERMPNLRQLLNGGWVLCDYKNGERRPEQLPHNGSTILEDSVIVEALAVLGIQVPEEQTKPIYSEDGRDTGRVEIVRKAAPREVVWLTYNVLVCGQDIVKAARDLRIRPRLPSWVPEKIRNDHKVDDDGELDASEFMGSAQDALKLAPHDMTAPGKAVPEFTKVDGELPRPDPMNRAVVQEQDEDAMKVRPPKRHGK